MGSRRDQHPSGFLGFMLRQQRYRVWMLAIAALVVALALPLAWSEMKNRVLGFAVAAVALLGGILLLRALWRTRTVRHEAWVSRVETDEPYFMAFCDCDWFGEAFQTEAEARAQALTHTTNVRPGLDRPLS